jgi:hypothetical protein
VGDSQMLLIDPLTLLQYIYYHPKLSSNLPLENDSINLIDWFSKNLMKANPDKFQAIAIGPKTNRHNLSFDLKGNKITCEANVKLLNRLGRLTIYYSFILSNFNYCPVRV